MADMRSTSIYALCHPYTNEVRYVGKTIHLDNRIKQHIRIKRDNTHRTNWVHSLPANPVVIVLEETVGDWVESERFWISYLKSLGANLVNSTSGGEGEPGVKLSEITKQKLSLANIGKTQTQETKDKKSLALSGRTRPPEVGRKISTGKLGKKWCADAKRRRSEKMKGTCSEAFAICNINRAAWNKGIKMPDTWVNPMGMLGKKHSTETKKKMSEMHKGKIISESQKELMRSAKLGTKASIETRKKLSDSHKGIIPSEETRKKLSDAVKLSWIIRKENMIKKGVSQWT